MGQRLNVEGYRLHQQQAAVDTPRGSFNVQYSRQEGGLHQFGIVETLPSSKYTNKLQVVTYLRSDTNLTIVNVHGPHTTEEFIEYWSTVFHIANSFAHKHATVIVGDFNVTVDPEQDRAGATGANDHQWKAQIHNHGWYDAVADGHRLPGNLSHTYYSADGPDDRSSRLTTILLRMDSEVRLDSVLIIPEQLTGVTGQDKHHPVLFTLHLPIQADATSLRHPPASLESSHDLQLCRYDLPKDPRERDDLLGVFTRGVDQYLSTHCEATVHAAMAATAGHTFPRSRTAGRKSNLQSDQYDTRSQNLNRAIHTCHHLNAARHSTSIPPPSHPRVSDAAHTLGVDVTDLLDRPLHHRERAVKERRKVQEREAETRTQTLRHLVASLANTWKHLANPREFWMRVKRFLKQAAYFAIDSIDIDGKVSMDPSLVKDGVVRSAKELFTQVPVALSSEILAMVEELGSRIDPHLGSRTLTAERPFTQQEISNSLRSLGRNKAPGLDGLVTEHYLALSPAAIARLAGDFNQAVSTPLIPASWRVGITRPIFKKGDPAVYRNWRPITLLTTDQKILWNLILERLKSSLFLHDLYPDWCWGFIADRSTMEPSFILRCMLDPMEFDDPVYAASVDIKGAFDVIPHHLIAAAWERVHAPFHQFLAKYLSGNVIHIITAYGLTGAIDLLRGVRQGGGGITCSLPSWPPPRPLPLAPPSRPLGGPWPF